MYWSRTGSVFDLVTWLLLCSLWWSGGWLLSTHLFRLRARERLFAGGAIGFLYYILLSNIIGLFLVKLNLAGQSGASLTTTYWIAATGVLACGLVASWLSPTGANKNVHALNKIFPIRESLVPWQLTGFIACLVLFAMINRGLAIFDDFANLPIVSTMAAGDFPPHFHLNPDQRLDYHYGLHLFAASLVRIGGFFPWSAFDLSKTLSTALTLILAWLWLRRFKKHKLTLLIGVGIILFSGGSRWLLLFAPEKWLQQVSAGIQLQGSALQTAPDLYSALPLAWNIEGDGPFPFAFAFTNGLFSPLFMALSGSGALPQMTLFLLLLLSRRNWNAADGLGYGLVLTSLALTGEHLFVMLWGGIFLSVLGGAFIELKQVRTQKSRRSSTSQFSKFTPKTTFSWVWLLLPGPLLTPFIGGVLTEFADRVLARLGSQTATSSVALPELGLRWPPAFLSAHLGTLSLTNTGQFLIALAEMGPVLWLAPFVSWQAWKFLRNGKWIHAGYGIAALAGFLAPMFISFSQRERDLSRLSGAALFIWLVMCLPYFRLLTRRQNKSIQGILTVGFLLTVFGGLALFPSHLTAIQRSQPSFFVEKPDALMSAQHWNRLQPGGQIMDLGYIHRAPALFGRHAGNAYENVYIRLPEFRDLMANPNPFRIAEAGYSYIYLDKQTWLTFSDQQRQAFQSSCVTLVTEHRTEMNDFRRLLDIRGCR